MPAQVPTTKTEPVVDTYHGVEVTDPYRWLEDWQNPAVKSWSESQNQHARQVLDGLPHVAEIRHRVTQIVSDETVSYWNVTYHGGLLFAMKRQPPKQQPLLVVFNDESEERVLVDPNTLDPEASTSIDWFVASHSGRWVAVSLSMAGTESGDVYFYQAQTGERVFEKIPRVNGGTAGGDLAWNADETGVFYTRYPRGDERPAEDLNFYQQLFYHRLGTATAEDRYELGNQLPRIAEIRVADDQASGRLLATVQDGDGGQFAHFLRFPDGSWQQFTKFGDRHLQAVFGPSDDLYVVSRAGAPRGRIIRAPINRLDLEQAEVVVDECGDTIVTDFWSAPSVLPVGDRLYVTYQLGGPEEIRAFDLDGRPAKKPQQREVSSAGGLAKYRDGQILFRSGSFLAPAAWFVFDPKSGTTKQTALVDTSSTNFDDCQVLREFATSKDGTKVPLSIIMPKTDRPQGGTRPCLVTGYGGYGISIEPGFQAVRRIALEQGMILVTANLRGGGEYGEAWHREGNLTNKQNVFDDFIAVLEHLIARGYTSPDKLAIEGGSNGGLLMGAVLTQRPDLMKAVVSHVGIYDMLRVELSPNGAFNIPEFGTVADAQHFTAMHAYSPYHNVVDGRKYPATLFLTGANDPRVDPMHSRKMAARLQAAAAGDALVLLRTDDDSGHGGGTPLNERIAQYVDTFSFIFWQLGIRET